MAPKIQHLGRIETTDAADVTRVIDASLQAGEALPQNSLNLKVGIVIELQSHEPNEAWRGLDHLDS